MASKIPTYFKSGQNKNNIDGFITEVRHCADKAVDHVAFQGNVPDYVSKSDKLSQLVVVLEGGRDAASGGDKGKGKELKALWADAQLRLDMNAFHITMLSVVRNDPSILNNAGYDLLEEKTGRSKRAVNVLDTWPELTLKHIPNVSGGISAHVKWPKQQQASCEMQMALQDPNVESSWFSKGINNKSHIEYRDLEPGSKVYLRARLHADGNAGRWCPYVGIIVI